MSEKVWFITGTSAASAGRRSPPWSAATRSPRPPATPTPWPTWRRSTATRCCRSRWTSPTDADFAAVKAAHDHFGRLDIVVNNAGYGHFGFVEELTEAEARARWRPTCSVRCG
jgi:hypothetical protein